MTAGTPVNLTASGAGNGEQHSLRRQPDTRPDFTVTGTSGTVTLDGCLFDTFRELTFTSGTILTGCKFVNCTGITLGTATMDTCTITGPLLAEGEAFVSTADLEDIDNSTFTI